MVGVNLQLLIYTVESDLLCHSLINMHSPEVSPVPLKKNLLIIEFFLSTCGRKQHVS